MLKSIQRYFLRFLKYLVVLSSLSLTSKVITTLLNIFTKLNSSHREVFMRIHARGYSILELLICTSIVGLLSLIMVPGLGIWKSRYGVETVIETYNRQINFARSSAVTSGKTITFCRSDNGLQCRGRWSDGDIIFSDANENHILDGDDQLLRYNIPQDKTLSIKFRSFQNKQYLQINQFGFTNYQNGNFTVCPADMDVRQAQQLIINTTARTRLAQDTDGDGIRENSQGKPLTCP